MIEKKFKFVLVFLLFSTISLAAIGQELEINGRVESGGNPLSGVSIVVKNTNNGTSSGSNGEFKIQVEKGQILLFTMMGYIPKEVEVVSTAELSVSLEEDLTDLDEVVVVGYGNQSKKDVTG